jgi:alpha-ketoglutarate-dependent taurine dioxygenase
MKAIERQTHLQPFGLLLETKPGATTADLSREAMLSLVREHKLVLVRGLAPLEKEELLALCARDPERDLIHWSFGPVMEMKADPATENYLFSREEVPLHWDGAFHLEPRVLVFNCLEAPDKAKGGQTTFADTEALWNDASRATRAAWRKIGLTYETEKKAHYGGRIRNPMVQHHPDKPVTVLRFAEPVRSELNPVLCEAEGIEGETETFLEEMRGLLYSEKYLFEHSWEKGDLLLADNFSLLHGRRAFSEASPRHLRRIQIR